VAILASARSLANSSADGSYGSHLEQLSCHFLDRLDPADDLGADEIVADRRDRHFDAVSLAPADHKPT
jgi:hypothetical protein